MAAIDAALPADDGVAYFNRLYRKTTEEVQQAVVGTAFEVGDFLSRLDVVFANLYFEAVAQSVHGDKIAPAWAPLFECRDLPDVHPIQFALAGMNAHINHDLPIAVVTTCRELTLQPVDDSPAHRDFVRVNGVLRETEAVVKAWFERGLLAKLDREMGKTDDALAMWSIATARDLAWQSAQVLWALDDHPHIQEAYLRTLRTLVRLGGNGILI